MKMICFAIPSSDENRLKQIIKKIESMEAFYRISPRGKVVFKVLASDNEKIPLSENEARISVFKVTSENEARSYLNNAGYSSVDNMHFGTQQEGIFSTSIYSS